MFSRKFDKFITCKFLNVWRFSTTNGESEQASINDTSLNRLQDARSIYPVNINDIRPLTLL